MRFDIRSLSLPLLCALLLASTSQAQAPKGATATLFPVQSHIAIRSADLIDLLRTRADQPYVMTVNVGKTANPNADDAELWFSTLDPATGAHIIASTSPLGSKPFKQSNGESKDYTVPCPDVSSPEVESWFLTHDLSTQILRDLKYSGPVEAEARITVYPVTSFDYRWKNSRDPLDNTRPVVLSGSASEWDKVVLEMTNLYPSHRRVVVVTQTDPPGPGFILKSDDHPAQSSDVTAGVTKDDAANTPRTVDFEFNPARLFLNSATYHVQIWVCVPLFGIQSPGPPPGNVITDPQDPNADWRWENPGDGAISFEVHRTAGVTGDIISN